MLVEQPFFLGDETYAIGKERAVETHVGLDSRPDFLGDFVHVGTEELVANTDCPEPCKVDEASVGVVLGHADENQALGLFDSRLGVVVDLVVWPGWVKLGANGPLVDGMSDSRAEIYVGVVKNKYTTREEMLRVGEMEVEERVDVGGSEGGGLLAEDAIIKGAGTGPEEISVEAIEAGFFIELLIYIKAFTRAMLVLGDEILEQRKALHGGLKADVAVGLDALL